MKTKLESDRRIKHYRAEAEFYNRWADRLGGVIWTLVVLALIAVAIAMFEGV